MNAKLTYINARRVIRRWINPLRPVRNTTPHPDQKDVLTEFLEGEGDRWVFWFDGGRADWFEYLYPEYFEGEYQRVWNGDIAYSGDWATRTLSQPYPDYGLFSSMPVRELQHTDYDGRKWFTIAPDIDTTTSVESRLAALGYREQTQHGPIDISPGHVNESVRENIRQLNGGVIRYLKPHPPLEGMEGLTSGGSKITATWRALLDGEITQAEFADAYEQTYRQAFESAQDVIDDLDGEIAITADHGECLGDCGQLFHGPNHTPHSHLTTVPFLQVDT